MDIYSELKELILSQTDTRFTLPKLLKNLNMSSNFDKEQIKNFLNKMIKENLIEKEGNEYIIKTKENSKKLDGVENTNKENKKAEKPKKPKKEKIDDRIKGVLRGNANGYGFVINDETEDLFVANRNLYGAQHGDTVLVRARFNYYNGKMEAVVSKIVERGYTNIIGNVYNLRGRLFVHPDMKEYFSDIFITESDVKDVKPGDKVLIEINKWGIYYPSGKVIKTFGIVGEPKSEAAAIISSYNFDMPCKSAETLAKKINKEGILDSDLVGRVDYTNLLTITIDGDDAKDFDDAISLEKNGDLYTLYVHIADVSNYVLEGSDIDKDAYERCTSVYFPGEVFPMIPKALSNGLCSLNEGNVRLTLTCKITLNSKGNIKKYDIEKSYIKSDHRMTYKNVTKIINGDKRLIKKYSDIYEMILNMKDLALLLHNNKEARGAIDFGNNDAEIVLDKDFNVLDIKPYDYTISNSIIEEFMILANEVVAEYFARMEYPFIYRIHEQPNEEKRADFLKFVRGCGLNIKLNKEFSAFHYQNILKKVEGTDLEKIISKTMLRTMQKAKYSTNNVGHFGLASEYYCHFTSPIRRYPDLMVHRIVKEFLDGKIDKKEIDRLNVKLVEIATKSTEREISAEKAERDADDFYKACYMKKRIGEVFEGTISGVTRFGVFVELDNTVEGLIDIYDLCNNTRDYGLDYDGKYSITGDTHSFNLGQRVTIKVVASDIYTKKVRFVLYTAKQKHKAVL